jgi:hypothetical protein
MLARMLAIDRSGPVVTTTRTRAPGTSGYSAEIDGTRLVYEHPETRRRAADFLDRSAAPRSTQGAPDEVR